MAKPFYTLEEVCDVLKKSQDEVKDLVRVGKLREFRDAGKVFFKSDDVMRLAPAGATLQAAEEDLPVVSDRGSGGTSVIGLVPDDEHEPAAPAARGPAPAQKKKEDSSLPLGGVSVLDDELEIDADPMAKTQITSGAIGDQATGESGRSGSGLMDLTRESDDTSLGAELLDEIYPGEEEAAAAPPKRKPAPAAPAAARQEEQEIETVAAAPVILPQSYAAAGDPTEGMFAGLLVGVLILFAVAGSVVGGVLQGFLPDYARAMSANFLYLLLGAVLIPVISLLIGWLIGRSSGAPRRA